MGLIRNVDREPNKQAVVNGIITMMVQLGGRIVAEGVETVEEYSWLKGRGIRLFQGYLFARPGFETLPRPYFPDVG
jgi:EAL domain-containing protein (putative c-di-GMP-specific phosphodiesterase class I)